MTRAPWNSTLLLPDFCSGPAALSGRSMRDYLSGALKRLYGQVRRAVYVEGMSRREAARRFGIDPRTVAKMLVFSVPPRCRRSRPPAWWPP